MRVTLIAAVGPDGVIGRDGDLPWRLPADLAHFKATTMGHHLVMGRKTFESTGALPGRTTIVVSRGQPQLPAGVLLAPTPERALALARERGEDEAFVAGGGEIYAQTMEVADRLVLTRVGATVAGDTHFPLIRSHSWNLVESRERPADERNPFTLTFCVYERAAPAARRVS